MSAKTSTLALLTLPLLASCMSPQATAPDTAAQKYSGAELAKQCEGRDGWSDPAPPAHVFGNVYMVGTCGIVSLLITSPKGHFLIDGATEKAAPLIADNIRKLGFDPRDVRYLLSSHEHDDHVGGLAALKNITGAQMLARAEAKAALESGKVDASDPQRDIANPFTGVKVDRVVSDGEQIKLGATPLTVIATPGHSPGGTSWAWRSCEGSMCHSFVYADSMSAVSADDYRFTDHPEYVAILRATLDRVAKIADCEILITPHPSASGFFERLAGTAPLVNKTACATYANGARERLAKRLADEATK